jgi:hypothetical protein
MGRNFQGKWHIREKKTQPLKKENIKLFMYSNSELLVNGDFPSVMPAHVNTG